MYDELKTVSGGYPAPAPVPSAPAPSKLNTAGMNIPMPGVMTEDGQRLSLGGPVAPAYTPEPEPARSSVAFNPEPPTVAQPTIESSSSDEEPLMSNDNGKPAAQRNSGPGYGPGGNADDREVADPTGIAAAPAGERVDPRLRPTLSNDADFIAWNQFQSYPDSLLEGWVWKESRWLRRWKRRYMVLRRGELCTYRSRGDAVPTENLAKVSSVVLGEGQAGVRAKSFVVAEGRNTFYIICDDDSSKKAWLQKVSETLLKK